ncbi:hypothetical protein [Streptomyces sp. NPDC002913]
MTAPRAATGPHHVAGPPAVTAPCGASVLRPATAPHAATRSGDGAGITVRDEAHCRLRATGRSRGLSGEMPDEPSHLALSADRVLRPREGAAGTDVPEEPHVMPCDRARSGQAALHDHSGTREDAHRS